MKAPANASRVILRRAPSSTATTSMMSDWMSVLTRPLAEEANRMLMPRDRRDKVFLQDAADLLLQECHAAIDCAAEGGEGDDAGRDESEVAGPVEHGGVDNVLHAQGEEADEKKWEPECSADLHGVRAELSHVLSEDDPCAAPKLPPVGEATVARGCHG